MTENIVLLGVLFLGGFVGLLLGLTLQLPKSSNLRLATGIIGAALGGAPVLFMHGLQHQKWMYPIGLVIGLLWIRVLAARVVVGKRPKKTERVAWYMAWADTLAVLAVTAVVVGSVTFIDMRDRDREDKAVQVTRQMMPCRWAWVYLGRYSPSKMRYELSEGFRYTSHSGLRPPVPATGDELILTREHTLIVTNYGSTEARSRCDSILHAPWGYRPETASQFEAGKLPAASLVMVNQVTLMPSADAEPAYVWALVGPRQ